MRKQIQKQRNQICFDHQTLHYTVLQVFPLQPSQPVSNVFSILWRTKVLITVITQNICYFLYKTYMAILAEILRGKWIDKRKSFIYKETAKLLIEIKTSSDNVCLFVFFAIEMFYQTCDRRISLESYKNQRIFFYFSTFAFF